MLDTRLNNRQKPSLPEQSEGFCYQRSLCKGVVDIGMESAGEIEHLQCIGQLDFTARPWLLNGQDLWCLVTLWNDLQRTGWRRWLLPLSVLTPLPSRRISTGLTREKAGCSRRSAS